MSESSKRPRPSGSFSPPSPPYHLHNQTKPTHPNPQTPISPPSMTSSSAQPGASSTPATSHSTLPTDVTQPASAAASVSFPQKDEDGDALMTDQPDASSSEDEESDAEPDVDENTEHRRTDHDWHHREPTARPEAIAARLSEDMGRLYKVCEQVIPMSRPHSSQNLVELYRLTGIAKSVRRVDPVTGEKINKIRKSYEGKVKSLGIAGRNKAVSTPGQWYMYGGGGLLGIPDDDWQAQQVNGKETSKLLQPAFKSRLEKALQMAPGKLPEREVEKYKSVIAMDDAKPRLGMDAAKKSVIPPQVSAPARPPSPAVKVSRPERAGTKRRYNDSSFTGYGEGYADDDMDISGDDRSGGGVKKKRRKDFSVTSPLGQAPSYGVGLVANAIRR